jgi:hypothetical protein
MPWSTKLDFPINKLKVNNPVNFINKFVCFFGDLIEFFVALRLCSFLCLIVGHPVSLKKPDSAWCIESCLHDLIHIIQDFKKLIYVSIHIRVCIDT